jgi:molecular chaperone GrpE
VADDRVQGETAGAEDAEAERLTERLTEAEDRHKRALADLANYRRRSALDADRRVAEARERLLRDWLEAVDSVERAIAMDPGLVSGLRPVLEQMETILARQGVMRSGAAGERFDPERHEAVAAIDTDEVPDRTVTEVRRSGFTIDDRALRPAQVAVARAPRRGG